MSTKRGCYGSKILTSSEFTPNRLDQILHVMQGYMNKCDVHEVIYPFTDEPKNDDRGVYVVKFDSIPELLKIGYTENLRNRLSCLKGNYWRYRTENNRPTVVAFFPTWHASDFEFYCHVTFDFAWQFGEMYSEWAVLKWLDKLMERSR